MFAEAIDVRKLEPSDPGYGYALHPVLEVAALSESQPSPVVRDFLDHARRRGLGISPVYSACAGSRSLTCSIFVESPGRSAMVMIGGEVDNPVAGDAIAALLRAVREAAVRRGNVLLQLLLRRENATLAGSAAAAGFTRLACLIYLRRARRSPGVRVEDPTPFSWVQYAPHTHSAFACAIECSYAQSLDCPELTGLRPIDDVIASHRSAGEFDPSLWWVALHEEAPVGVLLLSRMSNANALEVVYMGADPALRGRGIGDALLAKAVDTASNGANIMSHPLELVLAVDERNAPARRLYARWGFEEFARRDAWIATSPPTST